jgi:hypothetical protein
MLGGYKMNVFQKITPNRSAIALKLIENENIIKLLYYLKDDKAISEIPMPNDVFDEVYRKKIFKRTNVEGLVDVEDCFIMLSFPVITPYKNSSTYSTIKLIFNIMCHKKVIDTYEGDRIDAIVSEIFDMYNESTEFGFKLQTPIVKELSHKDYYISSVEFDVTEFTQNR